MTAENVDPAYLHYQYDDAEKLRIRIDTHARYSERTADTWSSWLLSHVDAKRGQTVLDVGCGPGVYHRPLVALGARIVGLDASQGMVREALAANDAADVAQADAQRLPIRDASVDRVMANHMLYHVPDQRAALAEFRRVLKQGGRAVISTNGADNLAQLDELHAQAVLGAGYAAIPHDALRFTLDDLALVRSAFPTAQLVVRNDAFIFADPDPALRFYGTYSIDSIRDRPADGSHRAPILREMRALIEEIIAWEGVLRVSKTAGCFVADL